MAKNRYGLGRVKRYRHSFYDSPAAKAKRILKWVLGAAAVFVMGFLVAPAVLNWGTHAWYTHVKGRDLSSSSAPASSSASASASSSASGAAASESAAAQSTAAGTMDAPQAGSWSVVSLSSLTDSTAIAQTAQTLKSQGVRYALIQLKDASGYVYYASGVASASGSIAASTIDAAAVAQAMTEQDIIPVAYICAFQDPIAAYTDRTMGIHYTGSDYMWLDAKADAGGKPWLNPYSASAVQYVGDLVQEALDMGLVNTVVPYAELEKETVRWCREMLQNSPIALRCLKAALNADCDGQAGLQELAGNATMLFYMTEEGQEGRNAFNEKRQPDFSKYKRNP